VAFPYATPAEFWDAEGDEHKLGCRCSDAGYCELAQLRAEERAEQAQEHDPSIPHAKGYNREKAS
jgi:hypothetical protein